MSAAGWSRQPNSNFTGVFTLWEWRAYPSCDKIYYFNHLTHYRICNKIIKHIYRSIYYMTMDDNTYYPTAIKIVLSVLWDNTSILVNT